MPAFLRRAASTTTTRAILQQAKTENELLPTIEGTCVEDSAELELGESSAA